MDDVSARLLACPECRSPIVNLDSALGCIACRATYEIVDGVPVLLPRHPSDERRRYVESYEALARHDLEHPIVENRFELMHRDLIDFIGDVRGKTVLDIGSAYGSYLRTLDAGKKIAVDIATPYLASIPPGEIMRVCGDAEYLPIQLREIDVVIISDVLEHLLDPRALVSLLGSEGRPDLRVIVHIPWRESLDQYGDSEYEFTHLHSFNEHTFRQLFWMYDIVRRRPSLPRIDEPIVFRMQRSLPRWAYNLLVDVYFRSDLAAIEQRYRERWINELPRRRRRLLRFYQPVVMLAELRMVRSTPQRRVLRWIVNRMGQGDRQPSL